MNPFLLFARQTHSQILAELEEELPGHIPDQDSAPENQQLVVVENEMSTEDAMICGRIKLRILECGGFGWSIHSSIAGLFLVFL